MNKNINQSNPDMSQVTALVDKDTDTIKAGFDMSPGWTRTEHGEKRGGGYSGCSLRPVEMDSTLSELKTTRRGVIRLDILLSNNPAESQNNRAE